MIAKKGPQETHERDTDTTRTNIIYCEANHRRAAQDEMVWYRRQEGRRKSEGVRYKVD